ncbi:MAG TPA: hypothetical protein VFX88_18735 [Actinomycetota bacterium]|nr:hypothetical protein [Actinomycetota bacterium]
MTGNDVRDEWRAPLDDLRTLRESLREEEQRTSYWRQLVQAGATSSAPRSRAATRAPTTWPAWKDCGTRRSRGTTRRPCTGWSGG